MNVAPNSLNPTTTSDAAGPSMIDRLSLPVLMIGLITLSGVVVSLAWEGDNTWRFAVIAVLSGVFAAIVSRTRVLDGLAMLLCITLGAGVIWYLTAAFSGVLEGSMWTRIQGLPQPLWQALAREDLTGINRDLTAETLLSLTIWMSSWVAIWILLRVGYVVLSLIPPTVLILANEHFTNQDRAWPLILMIALCILIIVRQRIRNQHRIWTNQDVRVSDSIVSKVLVSGLAIAVAVSSTVMISPAAWSQSVLQPLVSETIDRLQAVRTEAEYWFDDVLGTEMSPVGMGSYTDFSDGFSVGGPLNLTDTPEVLAQVNTESAPYLTARSYDNYTGRGWSSSSAGEFAEEGDSVRQSPELLYNPNWEVAISDEARNEREPITANITTLGAGSDLVFTVDTFLTANVQTVVRMSWTHVTDMPLVIRGDTLNRLPPDVQKLGSLLLQSELTGEQTSWGTSAVSGNMQAVIDDEVDDLATRGIQVRWTASSDGIIETLYVTGRLPVFDDVEAVFQRQIGPTSTDSYTVRGLTSVATPGQLAASGEEYPDWVTERYLQTGDTITDRTNQLTLDIIGDETNPYRQVTLIEQWLRTNITYDENVDAPPGDQDLVDYVLFDNRRGYCEHYSASMTVMLRSLGIPARVVVGYSPGQIDPQTGGWLYLQSNAHAWVEAYFPGYGWIPFEPTANRPLGEFDVQPGDPADEIGNQDQLAVPSPESMIPTANISTPDVGADNTAATPQPTEDDQSLAPPSVIADEADSGPPRWILPVGGVVGTAAIAYLGGWLLWHRGLRGLPPGAAMMKRLQRVGGWMGIPAKSTTTPREYARKFDHTTIPIASPVKRITRAYEIETFGPAQTRNQFLDDARKAWREIRGKALYVLWHRRKRS